LLARSIEPVAADPRVGQTDACRFVAFLVSLTMRTFALLLGLLCGCAPPPKNFDVYLLVGGSNMAGRGFITGNPIIDGIYVLDKNDRWQLAKHPLHFDSDSAAAGPGMGFARAIKGDKEILLVPC